MNLQQIDTFLEVARTGSFAAASRRMSLPTSTVSARIKAMEERIGTTLFRRTTRKVALTSDGQHFFEVYTEVFEILSSLEPRGVGGEVLSGHIRLTAPIDFPTSYLADVLTRFTDRHPAVTIDILMTDDVLDFVEDNIDIALRGRAPGAENLICRKFTSEQLGLFVSPDFFSEHRERLLQGQLKGLVLFDPLQQAATLGSAVYGTLCPAVRTTNKELCKAMAMQSRGVALLGHTVCKSELQSGALLALDDTFNLPDLPMYLVMPSKRLLPQRIRAFVDHLVDDQRGE
ncbi:LysR family transcriptional regulator [Phaeobacter sp. C3_T13_0]|uniref:LysR family transcriptional regulator n=1 Tax=Phaeobacter cretensis TaxID=3342641 RepID=UPI0039BC435D